jgi:hypothetical protein
VINPHVLPGNVGPFIVRRAVLTPRSRRGTIISFDAATWKAAVQLDGALAALNIKVADFVNTAALSVGAAVAVVLFNDSNPDDGLLIGTYGNVGSGWDYFVRAQLDASEYLTIPAEHQMRVKDEYTVEGELTILGELIVD